MAGMADWPARSESDHPAPPASGPECLSSRFRPLRCPSTPPQNPFVKRAMFPKQFARTLPLEILNRSRHRRLEWKWHQREDVISLIVPARSSFRSSVRSHTKAPACAAQCVRPKLDSHIASPKSGMPAIATRAAAALVILHPSKNTVPGASRSPKGEGLIDSLSQTSNHSAVSCSSYCSIHFHKHSYIWRTSPTMSTTAQYFLRSHPFRAELPASR